MRGLEAIDSATAWDDRALSKTVGTVHLIRTEVPQSMTVKTGSIVLKVVCDREFDLIAPISLNSLSGVSGIWQVKSHARTGPGNWPLKTIMGRSKPSGAIVTFVISKWYCRGQHMQLAIISPPQLTFTTFPVVGHSRSMSVSIL